MPTISLEAKKSALDIFKKASFEASVLIGKQQQANGAPLEPFAGQKTVAQLVKNGTLVIDEAGKIDVNPTLVTAE